MQSPHLGAESSHSPGSSPAAVFTALRSSHLQIAPSLPKAVQTSSQDGSRMQKLRGKEHIFEKKIREVAARRGGGKGDSGMRGGGAGGEGDDNPFMALCNSGILDECTARMDSEVMAAINEMAASLMADDHLQRHIDSFMKRRPMCPTSVPPNLLPSLILWILLRQPMINRHLHPFRIWSYFCLLNLVLYLQPRTPFKCVLGILQKVVLPSSLDVEDFPSCSSSPSTVPVSAAPPPPPQLQIAPATPNPTCTHSRDPSVTRRLTEKEQISEKRIEADKSRLVRVREAAAQRGGVLDMVVMDRRADGGMHECNYTSREFGTRRYALTPFLPNNSVTLSVVTDEALSGLDMDWAGDKTGSASISGFAWSYGGGPISWSAKKQNSREFRGVPGIFQPRELAFHLSGPSTACFVGFQQPLTTSYRSFRRFSLSLYIIRPSSCPGSWFLHHSSSLVHLHALVYIIAHIYIHPFQP